MHWPRLRRALFARPLPRTPTLALPLALAAAHLPAQTIDDGLMMPRGRLCAGFVYTHDAWDHYWEGPLKRTNGNIGTITSDIEVGKAHGARIAAYTLAFARSDGAD